MWWALIGFVLALAFASLVFDSSLGLLAFAAFWGGLMVLAFKHERCETLGAKATALAGTAAVTLAGWGLVAALV